MDKNSDIDRAIKRHRDFWDRVQTDRPLLGFPQQRKDSDSSSSSLPIGPLTPEKLEPDAFVAAYEEEFRQASLLEGDMFRVASAIYLPQAVTAPDGSPGYKATTTFIPWAEAIAGCSLEVLSGVIWAKEPPDAEKSITNPESLEGNPWFAKLLEITRALDQRFAGTFPTAPPMLRGPADIVASLMSAEKMCLNMVKEPAKVSSLIQKCTDIWLEANKRLREAVTEFHGGYCDPRFRLWAPGICLSTQEDCAMFFNPPSRYNKFLMGANRRMAAVTPHSIMHIHSSSLHTVEPLLGIPDLGAIQMNVDTNGPTVSELMPTFAKIQQEKSLILFKSFSKQELEELLEHLSPAGLCIMVRPETDEEAIEIMKRLAEEKS